MYRRFVVNLGGFEGQDSAEGSMSSAPPLVRNGTLISYPVPSTMESTSDSEVPSTKWILLEVRYEISGLTT